MEIGVNVEIEECIYYEGMFFLPSGQSITVQPKKNVLSFLSCNAGRIGTVGSQRFTVSWRFVI